MLLKISWEVNATIAYSSTNFWSGYLLESKVLQQKKLWRLTLEPASAWVPRNLAVGLTKAVLPFFTARVMCLFVRDQKVRVYCPILLHMAGVFFLRDFFFVVDFRWSVPEWLINKVMTTIERGQLTQTFSVEQKLNESSKNFGILGFDMVLN